MASPTGNTLLVFTGIAMLLLNMTAAWAKSTRGDKYSTLFNDIATLMFLAVVIVTIILFVTATTYVKNLKATFAKGANMKRQCEGGHMIAETGEYEVFQKPATYKKVYLIIVLFIVIYGLAYAASCFLYIYGITKWILPDMSQVANESSFNKFKHLIRWNQVEWDSEALFGSIWRLLLMIAKNAVIVRIFFASSTALGLFIKEYYGLAQQFKVDDKTPFYRLTQKYDFKMPSAWTGNITLIMLMLTMLTIFYINFQGESPPVEIQKILIFVAFLSALYFLTNKYFLVSLCDLWQSISNYSNNAAKVNEELLKKTTDETQPTIRDKYVNYFMSTARKLTGSIPSLDDLKPQLFKYLFVKGGVVEGNDHTADEASVLRLPTDVFGSFKSLTKNNMPDVIDTSYKQIQSLMYLLIIIIAYIPFHYVYNSNEVGLINTLIVLVAIILMIAFIYRTVSVVR